MKYLVLIIALLFCSVSYGQCPGGTCARPIKEKTVSVLKKTENVTKTVVKKTVAKKRFLRLRWHR